MIASDYLLKDTVSSLGSTCTSGISDTRRLYGRDIRLYLHAVRYEEI